MEKIKIKICGGTTCFVMGAVKLQDITACIPANLKNQIDIRMHPCLNLCANDEYAKSPYVMVGNKVIAEATSEKIIASIQKQLSQTVLEEEHE